MVLTLVYSVVRAADAQVVLHGPTSRAVFQRDSTNRANLPIRGTYVGNPTAIEARAIRHGGNPLTDWQTVISSPTGGSFNGALDLPAGGWYDIEVRALNGSTPIALASVERVGVGDVFITAGQSNAANHGKPAQLADDRVSALANLSTGAWLHGNDPQPLASGSDGSPWPAMGNALVAQHNVPVGFISLGNGGTAVANWLPGDTLYGRLRTALQLIGPHGARAVLWHQRESDGLEGTSAANYASRLTTIIAQSRTDAGWNVPWGVAIASYHSASTPAQQAQVVTGQQLVIDGDPLVFQGAETDSFHNLGYLWDNVHFNALGLQAHGGQWANAVNRYFSPVPEPSTGALCGVTGMLIHRAFRCCRRR
jgi:hypothetical protein